MKPSCHSITIKLINKEKGEQITNLIMCMCVYHAMLVAYKYYILSLDFFTFAIILF